MEVQHKLFNDENRTRSRFEGAQSGTFSELLDQGLNRYRNRAIETAQVIEELIALAKKLGEGRRGGEELGLSDAELAFYDALETNDSAVQVLGDDILRQIAKDVADTVRQNATIDWNLRESARANLRRHVKRVLRRYKYPPDKQESATQTIIQQAELIAADWAA